MPQQPRSPIPQVSEDNPLERVNFRLWQIMMSAATLLVTVWFFTLNAVAGIIALFIAKHVLVAILASGLMPPKTPTVRPEGAERPES